jgi:hypothetical protein
MDDPFLAAARTTLRQQRQAFETVIASLPADALDWQPASEANSLTVLITHAWGAAEGLSYAAALGSPALGGDDLAVDRVGSSD